MRVPSVRLVIPFVAAVTLTLAGCASPPEAEKKAADAAVAAARAAGADKYAASAFAAMSDALKTAESEMAAKKYTEAKASYEKLKGLAEQAAKAAESGKAAMKAEVEKAAGELESRWQQLSTMATAAAKKLKPEAKQAWEADSKAVTEGLKAITAAAATDAAGAKEKLGAVTASIEKWTQELAALAAPPPAKAGAKAPAAKPKP